jgi:uncharacterized protein YegP (UPF0339 family)
MVHEDYLSCSAYEGKEAHAEAGFTAFYDEASQRYFFAMLDASGKVLLKSEGYPQAAARENGIQSVIKNRPNRDFYSVKEENGKYYLSLRAANYREIARSCSCDSEAEALAILPYATGEKVRNAVVVESAIATEKERANDRREDNYLACREYEGRGDADDNGIVKWQHSNEQYYFTWVNADGSTKMRSEGYPTKGARDNGADSVVRNRDLKERYDIKEIGGRYFVTLKAGNHQEIARSCPKDSAAAFGTWFPVLGLGGAAVAAEAITASTTTLITEGAAEATSETVVTEEIVEAASEKVVAEATTITTTAAVVGGSSDDKEDDYLPCKEYEGKTVNDKVNNVALFKHDNGQFYFAVYNADGSVRLRSEGFRTAQERDVELSGVLRNLNNRDMYTTVRRGSYYMDVLKDKTGREVGRSCLLKDVPAVVAAPVEAPAPEVVVEAPAPVEVAAPVAAAAVVTALAATTTETETVAVVEEAPAPVVETVAAAEAAPPTVVAEPDVEDDYLPCKEYQGKTVNDKVNNVALFKHDNGQYYFAIYNTEGGVRLRSEGFRSAQERDVELSGVLKNLNNPDMYSTIRRGDYYIQVLKDKTGREVGRSCLQKDAPAPIVAPAPVVETVAATAVAATVVAAATTTTETTKVVIEDVEDDYLPCKEYQGKTVNDKVNNVALFKHENGQYYFAIYNADGSVRLRSEGFRTSQERDGELSGALRNLNNPDMYTTIRRGEYYIQVLKDKTGREVGRSCLSKEEPKAIVAPVAAAAAVVAAAATVVAEPAKPAVDVEDDYLTCKEYHGHTTSPRKGFTTFKSDRTGKYYFAVVDEDGDVSLRSEGHLTEAERDADMADVVRNMFIKERYEVKQVGLSHHFIVLRDEKGKEIARSCAYTDKAAMAAAAPFLFPAPKVETIAPVVAAAAPVVAAAAAALVQKEEVKVEKVVAKAKPIVEAAAPIVEAEEVAAAASGFNWWWLLLPLLLLLGWLLLGRGCNKAEVAAPVTTIPVDTVRAVAPAPVAAPTCAACASSTDPIFTSVCDNPKKLSRLGTNPEFGNSHALSPVEFYDKLKKAHANNDVDKEFLDRIFKGMGYAGFADAKADMFSAVVLPEGTTGKLGYSKTHKTGCYTLPDDEYHRKAFHIKSANGCDFHFMKTCGNHFFFCPK